MYPGTDGRLGLTAVAAGCFGSEYNLLLKGVSMKKSSLIAAAMVAATVLVSGMAVSAQEGPEEMCRSYLTGKQVPVSIGRKRPVGLMIENDADAVKWQRGTSYADVMYEAMVEGGITRLEGFFEDYRDAPMIMPIRSCRPYYVYYAREFDAYYGHYGQVIYAVPILQWGTCDIAGLPFGEASQDYRLHDGSSAYIRDHEGVTGIYTNYDLIQQAVANAGWQTVYKEGYDGHYRFAADGEEVYPENGIPANVVLPGFINNHARFDYNEADGLYYRSEFGSPQIDQLNGQQLAYKNIIIQECPSAMFDDHYLWTDPVAGGQGGTGWFITNGKAEPITWRKENWNADEPVGQTITSINLSFDVRECDFNVTRYYDENGNEITLNQGKTFVEIVRNQDDPKVVITDDYSIDSHIIDGL